MKLTEKLDFSFSIKDFDSVSKVFEEYITERVNVFKETFLNREYTEQEEMDYIGYYISPIKDTDKKNVQLGRVVHFLQREYELFILPSIQEPLNSLLSLLTLRYTDYAEQDIVSFEGDILDKIIENWEKLYKNMLESPYLIMKDFKKDSICGVTIYYREDKIDPDLLEEYISFITDMNETFSKTLKRIDSILFVPQSYIDFVAGEGTTAFFINDEIFMPEVIKEEDKEFFLEALYHEFGHFIFSLMTESSQILWYDNYNSWVDKKLKLTRDEGKNDVEELFADCFSRVFSPVHDFIQEPNLSIIDCTKNLLELEFLGDK